MNPTLQKFGPPALVFGIALYLGWPPSEPMDLGDDVVRAKSVRWKPSDLESPQPNAGKVVDPFRPVLVEEVPVQIVQAVVEDAPKAASAGLVRSQLFLTGIAQMGKQRWAIINGKTQSVGDELTVDGKSVFVQSILDDHVIIRSGDQKVELKRSKSVAPIGTLPGMPVPAEPSRRPGDQVGDARASDQSLQTVRNPGESTSSASDEDSPGKQTSNDQPMPPNEFVSPKSDVPQ